nr:hypothetical protein CFP56_11586 [Quercus suber]
MSDDKVMDLPQPRPATAWWCRRDTMLALQAILTILLVRFVLYSYTSLDPSEREASAPFIIKFAALMVVLLYCSQQGKFLLPLYKECTDLKCNRQCLYKVFERRLAVALQLIIVRIAVTQSERMGLPHTCLSDYVRADARVQLDSVRSIVDFCTVRHGYTVWTSACCDRIVQYVKAERLVYIWEPSETISRCSESHGASGSQICSSIRGKRYQIYISRENSVIFERNLRFLTANSTFFICECCKYARFSSSLDSVYLFMPVLAEECVELR